MTRRAPRSRVPRSPAPLALALALALLALAPAAAGDHVYTHRYFVLGRIVDAGGEPVSGGNVTVDLPGMPMGPCAGSPADPRGFRVARTGPEGDFAFCFHTHGFEEGQEIVVNASGERVTRPVDADTRKTVLLHRLSTPSALKDAGGVQFFPFRYAVVGRLWNESGPALLENVKGNGTPLADVEVTATLTVPGSETVARTVRSDAWGDYAITFQLGKAATEGTLRVAIAGADARVPLDPVFRKSVVNLALAPAASVEDPAVQAIATPPPDFGPSPGELPPGSTPVPSVGVAVAAAAVAAAALARRRPLP